MFDRASLSRALPILLVTAAVLSPSFASADPSVQSVSSTGAHGSTSTITGSGFGSKSGTSPAVWDSCPSAGLSSQWSNAWPNKSGNDNLQCRSPIRGISPPHNNVSMYLAGAHSESNGADEGYNVIAFKNRNINSYPAYTYASWYQRSDDQWDFCGDNNYKVFDFSQGTSPYTQPANWYIEYNSPPTSASSGLAWHLNDNGSALDTGTSWWFGSAVNPMSGKWTKIEVEIRYSPNSDGYIKLWENGRQRIDYSGSTDRYSGSGRSEGIGGYARCYGRSSNWRYFSDVYIDYTRARVILTDNQSYENSTKFEPQPVRTWSSGSIEFTLNRGAVSGSSAYIFVFDSSGRRNAVGVPLGGSAPEPPPPEEEDTRPMPPENLRQE